RSSADGSTGTTTASACSSQIARSSAMAPAGASTTTRWVSSGSDFQAVAARLAPAIGRTALSSPARRSAQRVDDCCGSASMIAVRRPSTAACAARWVAIVVLPAPPLELATSTVFMRSPVTSANVRQSRVHRPTRHRAPRMHRLPSTGSTYPMSDLQDLAALIRADTPLIIVETPDEPRVVELFRQSLLHVWRALYRWTITEGLRRLDLDGEDPTDDAPDATSTLRAIHGAEQRGVYLLLDFHPYLGYAGTQRMLRDLVQRRGCQPHVLVLVGHKVELPAELEARAVRFGIRLPDANALLKLVREEAVRYQAEHGGRRVEADADAVKLIVRNLQGLSLGDARRIARQLIFNDGALGRDDLPQLAKLKFELLNRSGHLHYEYDTAGFADVAGARALKRWIDLRRSVFTSGSAPPGLDPPKGV